MAADSTGGPASDARRPGDAVPARWRLVVELHADAPPPPAHHEPAMRTGRLLYGMVLGAGVVHRPASGLDETPFRRGELVWARYDDGVTLLGDPHRYAVITDAHLVSSDVP